MGYPWQHFPFFPFGPEKEDEDILAYVITVYSTLWNLKKENINLKVNKFNINCWKSKLESVKACSKSIF